MLLTPGNARTTLAPSGPRPPPWDPAGPGENWRPQYSSFFLGHRTGYLPFYRPWEKLSTLQSLLQSLVSQAWLSPSGAGVPPWPPPSCGASGLPWAPLSAWPNWSPLWYALSVLVNLPQHRHKGQLTLVVILWDWNSTSFFISPHWSLLSDL